jgi:hypothetical protein
MKDERREHLLLVTDSLMETWNRWSGLSDVRYLTRVFEEAIEDCLTIFEDGSIPGDLRTLNNCVDTLREQWAAYQDANETAGGTILLPPNAFWRALEQIEATRKTLAVPKRRVLESIADLTTQKVTDAQICRMYGFTDTGMPNGNPELWQLAEERATPGKHTDRAKGWLPPWEKQAQTEEANQREIVERVKRTRESKMKLLTEVAPEPIEQLVQEGVSGKQICKMKKITEDELHAYCEEHGLPAPTWAAESPNQMVGVHDYTPEDEEADTATIDAIIAEGEGPEKSPIGDKVEPTEPMTLEQEIIMYHRLGTMTPTEIAAAVSREESEVSRQKVNAVVKRWEAEPAAFEPVEV